MATNSYHDNLVDFLNDVEPLETHRVRTHRRPSINQERLAQQARAARSGGRMAAKLVTSLLGAAAISYLTTVALEWPTGAGIALFTTFTILISFVVLKGE